MLKKISILLLLCTSLFAQKKSSNYHYRFEVGSYFSIYGKLPFWQANNQWGAIPDKANTLVVKQRIQKDYDSTSRFFKVGFGGEVMSVLGNQAKIMLPEYYINSKLGIFEICAGRKREVIGFVDSTLSSGSITWSSNALPLPKVQIGIPNYTRLIFNWLSFKGMYAHGWFGNQTFVKNYFLHQKTLFIRLGKPNSKLKLHGGIIHNVQWGGTPKYELPPSEDRFLNGKFPADFYTYGNVVIPFKKLWNSKDSLYNAFETANRFGNHVGSIDLGADIDLPKARILVYKQSIFDDGELFNLVNADDGLYGFSITSKNKSPFKKVVFEYLFTKNQGDYVAGLARLLNFTDRHPNNNNFYFNHAQYYDGWSYNRRTIGTPFMTPQENIRNENRIDNSSVFVNNNKIVAFYGAILNQIGKIGLVNRFSYSRNFGAFNNWGIEDLNKLFVTQASYSMMGVFYVPKLKADICINIGIDHGDLVKDNFGAYLSYVRKW